MVQHLGLQSNHLQIGIRIPDIILNTEISIYRKMGYDVKIIEVAGIYYTYMKKK